jgi:DNA sulfur modification protein DndD
MFIKQVKLKNYRQYRGETVIDLDISGDKNINVIVGSIGSGKTNISNAIQWCFYDKEPSLKDGIDFGILNINAFKDLEEEKTIDVSVEVVIELENGEKYSIERVKTIQKTNNREEIIYCSGGAQDGSKLKAYFHRTAKSKSASLDTDYPDSLINIQAPEKISEYFFFDGEKLDKYFTTSSKEKIKESIFSISQLDLLRNIDDKLGQVIKEYRQDVKGLFPELDEITTEINKTETELDDVKKNISQKHKILSDIKEKKVDTIREYKDFGGDAVKNILERNEQLKNDITTKEEGLLDLENEKSSFLITNGYLFWGMDALKDSLVYFEDARNKKLIPPNISPDFVENLLKTGQCICKTDISEKNKNKEPRKNIKELIKEISTGIAVMASELLSKEKDIIFIKENQLKTFFDKLESFNKPIKEYQGQIDRWHRELDNNISKPGVDKKGSKEKLEKMENFDQRISNLEEEADKLVGEIAVLEAKKDECIITLKSKKEEYEERVKKQNKGKQINNFIGFCEKAQACAVGIKTKIMDEIRLEISNKTEEYYKELHWKKEDIDISIDEDYQIFARQNGRDKFGAFSAGERAFLAMSFLIALNRVSGFNVPIIMDTTLGRISTEPRENFSKNIAKYLKGNQIILLFTEAEFSQEVKKNLMPAINRQYIINLPFSPLEAKIEKIK